MTLVQDPLEQVLTAIQQRWGPDALRPLGELSTQQIPLPTGFTALDDLVSGWPRGRLSLVTGGPTAGLTTLGLHALAAAQREDRPALIVDVGRTLDPASAVRCGVDLDQVLLFHPAAGTLGLSLVRDVVACGGSGIILLDASLSDGRSRQTPMPTRDLQALAAALPRTRWVVLCLSASRDPLARAAASYAGLRLHVEREGWLQDGQDITGCAVRVTVRQHPSVPPGQSARLTLVFDAPVSGESA